MKRTLPTADEVYPTGAVARLAAAVLERSISEYRNSRDGYLSERARRWIFSTQTGPASFSWWCHLAGPNLARRYQKILTELRSVTPRWQQEAAGVLPTNRRRETRA